MLEPRTCHWLTRAALFCTIISDLTVLEDRL
jgi:hypothetical protein